jgi:hypothetical protein
MLHPKQDAGLERFMRDDRFAYPIWQLEPGYADERGYDDYERLFLAAYRAAFRMHASPERVCPYVNRYLRFYVVAPWVREFARGCGNDPLALELAGAPLDPQLDWRRLARWFEGALPLLYVRRDGARPGQVNFVA